MGLGLIQIPRYRAAAELASGKLIEVLPRFPPPALPVEWGLRKYSRQNYLAMCEIPLDISKSELERRLKVFGGNYFGVAPSIRLHGVEFRAVTQPQAVAEIETLGRN